MALPMSLKVDHIIFWLWEYTRRRSVEKSQLSQILASHGFINEYGIRQYTGEVGQFNINIVEGEKAFYKNSDELLQDSVHKTVSYIYPHYTNIGKYESVLRPTPDINNYLLVNTTLDLSKPLEMLLREITNLHASQNYLHYMLENDEKQKVKYHELEQGYFLYRLKEQCIDMKRIVINDIARAIGLWLYDYLSDRSLSITYKHHSRNAFRAKYQDKNNPSMLIQKYRKDSQLDELLEKTYQCIEQGKVLPMG